MSGLKDIPRGQLSTIILSSLLDGDKYGYEIIDSIQQRTNGEIIIKRPSLYSTLSRMEKQDLVSSYWRDSDIGGRRHYYRLTDFGKKQVLQWQDQLFASQNKLAQILQKSNASALTNKVTQKDKANKQENESHKSNEQSQLSDIVEKSTFLQQQNLFNLASQADGEVEQSLEKSEPQEQDNSPAQQDFIQYNLFSNQQFIQTPNTSQEKKGKDTFMPDEIKLDEIESKNKNTVDESAALKEQSKQPIKPESNALRKNVAKILESEGKNFDERLKKAKQSFNFESEYRKHLKLTKSYAETINVEEDRSTNVNMSSFSALSHSSNKYESEKSFSENLNSNLKNNNNSAEFEINNQTSLEKLTPELISESEVFIDDADSNNLKTNFFTKQEHTFFESEISFEEEVLSPAPENQNHLQNQAQDKEVAFNQEESSIDQEKEKNTTDKIKKLNSGFISERMENPPKVRKIAPASFAHLNNKPLTKRQVKSTDNAVNSAKHSQVNQKELSLAIEKKKNKPLTEEEKYFKKYDITVTKHRKDISMQNRVLSVKTSSEFLKINAFNFWASLSVLLLFLIQTVVLAVVLNHFNVNIKLASWLYLGVFVIGFVLFSKNLFSFLKHKDKNVNKNDLNLTPFWQKIIFIVILLVLNYSIHILLGMNEFNYLTHLPTLLLPMLLSVDYLIYHFVQLFYFKV